MKINIKELVEAKIISPDIADAIEEYYKAKADLSSNKLMVTFGILGALMVGFGIILILAHNWDDFSRGTRIIFAFIPLILGQLALAHSIFRQKESKAWREASACFLTLAIGACISLISQIYNIEGNLGSFLLLWCIVVLPIVYLAQSHMASLLYLMLISFYAVETYFDFSPKSSNFNYWLLFVALIPYYFKLFKECSMNNFTTIHSFMIPVSLTLGLGVIFGEFPNLLSIAFMSLFGAFYTFGYWYQESSDRILTNGFIVVGSVAMQIMLLIASFEGHWEYLSGTDWSKKVFSADTFYSAIIFFFIASLIFYFYFKNKGSYIINLKPLMPVYLVYFVIFLIGQEFPILAQGLINGLIFVLGIFILKQGASMNHLGVMNYGLAIISILMLCRFFDTDISFIWRGIIFVTLGIGFFMANYWLIKQRRTHAK